LVITGPGHSRPNSTESQRGSKTERRLGWRRRGRASDKDREAKAQGRERGDESGGQRRTDDTLMAPASRINAKKLNKAVNR
jgi:hypothetical protein